MPTPKGLRFPSSSGAVVVPADIQKLAEDVDGLLVPATGGTYSGMVAFTQPPNVPTPVVNTNAATKAYVDQVTVNHILDMAGTVGNLLTENQASLDTVAAGLSGYHATLAQESGTYRQGAGAVKVTIDTASPGTAYLPTGLNGIPVTQYDTYTTSVTVLASVNTPTVAAAVEWFDAAGDSLYAEAGAAVASQGDWRTVTASFVAPAYAAYASPRFAVAGAVGDAILADMFGYWKGAGGQWAMPGTPITNTGVRPNPANTAEVQVWNSATATWITV